MNESWTKIILFIETADFEENQLWRKERNYVNGVIHIQRSMGLNMWLYCCSSVCNRRLYALYYWCKCLRMKDFSFLSYHSALNQDFENWKKLNQNLDPLHHWVPTLPLPTIRMFYSKIHFGVRMMYLPTASIHKNKNLSALFIAMFKTQAQQ